MIRARLLFIVALFVTRCSLGRKSQLMICLSAESVRGEYDRTDIIEYKLFCWYCFVSKIVLLVLFCFKNCFVSI